MRAESELIGTGYGHPDFVRRRQVLHDTLQAFGDPESSARYAKLAAKNLERWSESAADMSPPVTVRVLPGDWGEVTQRLTRQHGACFAVLNMANAFVPGGAYIEGSPAQEENMFRRTNCHFHVDERHYNVRLDCYFPDMTDLISGRNGRVYLDTIHPRICIRGPEDRAAPDLGYTWLPEDEIFPFYELRAAAQDLRGGDPFDPVEARRRIAAQLDTLIEHRLGHAVLGASGCGAFRNPSEEVARIYREEIGKRADRFCLIAFAIFEAGYGPGNYEPFRQVFEADG